MSIRIRSIQVIRHQPRDIQFQKRLNNLIEENYLKIWLQEDKTVITKKCVTSPSTISKGASPF